MCVWPSHCCLCLLKYLLLLKLGLVWPRLQIVSSHRLSPHLSSAEFREPRVIELWEAAKRANLTQDELDSLKVASRPPSTLPSPPPPSLQWRLSGSFCYRQLIFSASASCFIAVLQPHSQNPELLYRALHGSTLHTAALMYVRAEAVSTS